MLLEPMYLLMGRNFDQDDDRPTASRTCTEEEATSAIFASEPLTEGTDDWSTVEFGEIVFLEKDGENITRNVSRLKV